MGFNAKLFEVVLYADSFDFCSLPALLGAIPGLKHYAYCVHDQCVGQDDSKLKEHLHLALRMSDTRNSDNIAKWFQASPSQVEKCKGRWADMLAYLIHSNAPEKHQYEPSMVVSNFDWQIEADKAGEKNGSRRLAEIAELIVSGVCREYNYPDYITPEEFMRYETQINRAYRYRIDNIKKENREMEVIYICGASGSGKTSYAKFLAEAQGLKSFIAGSSNDPLDGYRGESCLILDDLRASCMSISDLLKMLDNHTGSLVKSRYKNKFLECRLVIITSIKTIDQLYAMFVEQDEPLEQLKRRCGTVITMTKSDIIVDIWDGKKHARAQVFPNFILALIEKDRGVLTEEKKQETIRRLMGGEAEFVKKLEAERGQASRPLTEYSQRIAESFPPSMDDVPF